MAALRNLCRVLLEDSEILVLSKPHGVLSTPGRELRVRTSTRAEEWAETIIFLHDRKKSQLLCPEEVVTALSVLRRQAHGVPRQKEKLLGYLQRSCKIKDVELQESIWSELESTDRELHSTDMSSLPSHLVSAADFAEHHTGGRIHHVHRLDQETSGVLLFAKSTPAAAALSEQFRSREVRSTELYPLTMCSINAAKLFLRFIKLT